MRAGLAHLSVLWLDWQRAPWQATKTILQALGAAEPDPLLEQDCDELAAAAKALEEALKEEAIRKAGEGVSNSDGEGDAFGGGASAATC